MEVISDPQNSRLFAIVIYISLNSTVIEISRQHDWDDIVTCHLGMTGACTWSSDKRAKGKHKLKKDKHNAALVTILFRVFSAYIRDRLQISFLLILSKFR